MGKSILAGLMLSLVCACSFLRANSLGVTYLIPSNFEGPVIILYDQRDGVVPPIDGGRYMITVPQSGVVNTRLPPGAFDEVPLFFVVTEDGHRESIELLFRWGPEYPYGRRTKKDLSEAERSQRFAMYYDRGNFSSRQGSVSYSVFLFGKQLDENQLFGLKEKKITDIQRSLGQ